MYSGFWLQYYMLKGTSKKISMLGGKCKMGKIKNLSDN